MAQSITIMVPHKLGRAEARARVEASVGRFKHQLAGAGVGNMQHAWADDRLQFRARALGQTITGRVDVNDDNLKIEVDLPGLLGVIADKIAGKIRRQAPLLLEEK